MRVLWSICLGHQGSDCFWEVVSASTCNAGCGLQSVMLSFWSRFVFRIVIRVVYFLSGGAGDNNYYFVALLQLSLHQKLAMCVNCGSRWCALKSTLMLSQHRDLKHTVKDVLNSFRSMCRICWLDENVVPISPRQLFFDGRFIRDKAETEESIIGQRSSPSVFRRCNCAVIVT